MKYAFAEKRREKGANKEQKLQQLKLEALVRRSHTA